MCFSAWPRWEQETQDDGYPLHVPPKNAYSKSSTTFIARLGSEAVSNAFAPSSNLNVWVIIWVTFEVLFASRNGTCYATARMNQVRQLRESRYLTQVVHLRG